MNKNELPKKVYLVNVGGEIKLYKSKIGWSYFKRYKNAQFFIGEMYDWEDVTEQVKETK